jgi:hypothetical protein
VPHNGSLSRGVRARSPCALLPSSCTFARAWVLCCTLSHVTAFRSRPGSDIGSAGLPSGFTMAPPRGAE